MNTKDYGQHASGYRRPGPDELSRGFAFRLVFRGPRVRGVRRLGDDAHGGARIPSRTGWPRSWASGSFHSD